MRRIRLGELVLALVAAAIAGLWCLPQGLERLSVDGVALGMTRAEVLTVLGKPDYHQEDLRGDSPHKRCYDSWGGFPSITFVDDRVHAITGRQLRKGTTLLLSEGDPDSRPASVLGSPDKMEKFVGKNLGGRGDMIQRGLAYTNLIPDHTVLVRIFEDLCPGEPASVGPRVDFIQLGPAELAEHMGLGSGE